MKNKTGIWIDSSRAIIVSLSNGEEKTTEIESDVENRIYHDSEGDKGSFSGSQHMNNENKFDERNDNQMNTFLKEVIAAVKEADELFVFGPAEAKIKLEKKIKEENTIDAGKLKAVETSDSMTMNQIIAKVKDFYKA